MTRLLPPGRHLSRRLGFAIVVALVLARSAAGLYWSDVHFDADQAVTGLMAKHVAEGRAFPVYQYGAQYVLVLEAWLAAPLTAIDDSSPALIRAVPVAFNVAAAVLLYGILSRSAGLSPAYALLATAPVAWPGVSTTHDLTAAIGMNIEPLFFALVFWLLRARPIALGVTAAIAVKNREFAVYALAALLLVDLLRDRSGQLWRPRVAAAVAFASIWALVGVLNQFSSPFGPGTNLAMMGAAGDNVAVAASAMCVAPAEIPGDLARLAADLLPFQYGVRSAGWARAGHPGSQPPDASWLWWPLVAVLVFGAGRGLARAWRLGPSPATWVGLYLVLTGVQAVLVYGVTRCGHASVFTLRYTLLSLLIASGAIALGVEREPSRGVRALIAAVCLVWFSVCALGHVAVIRGFLASPPSSSYRQLAAYLEREGIRYIRTDYWTGYHVAFLTGERVRPLTDFDRIQEYSLAVTSTPRRNR